MPFGLNPYAAAASLVTAAVAIYAFEMWERRWREWFREGWRNFRSGGKEKGR